MGGTVERLLIYALGEQLDAAQMAALKSETDPGDSREEFESFNAALTSRSLDPVHRSRELSLQREVGRQSTRAR